MGSLLFCGCWHIRGEEAEQQNPAASDQPTKSTQQNGPPAGQQPGAQNKPDNPPVPDAMREAIRTAMGLGTPPGPQAAAPGQRLLSQLAVSAMDERHGWRAGAEPGALDHGAARPGNRKEIGPSDSSRAPRKGNARFANLSDDQVHDIAQFLLGRTQAAANRMEYTIQNIVTGDAHAGRIIFRPIVRNAIHPRATWITLPTNLIRRRWKAGSSIRKQSVRDGPAAGSARAEACDGDVAFGSHVHRSPGAHR